MGTPPFQSRRFYRLPILTRSVSGSPGRGCRGAVVTFAKVTKEALWEGFSFPEKPGKSAFRFTKSIRDGFNVTFCGVQKVTKKHAGLTPCDLGSKPVRWDYR